MRFFTGDIMLLFLRYLKIGISGIFSSKRNIILFVFLFAIWILLGVSIMFIEHSPIYILLMPLGGMALFLFIYALLMLMVFCPEYELHKIMDEKGFSEEYLRAFEKKRLIGKNQTVLNRILYAEIFLKLKNPKAAIDILNELTVPESNANERTCYIFIYMMSALKLGDTALADDIWRTNQMFINRQVLNDKTNRSVMLLYVAMTYADCSAGRLDRALATTEKYHKVNKNCIDMYILKIYVLTKLGRTAEAEAATKETNALINKDIIFYRSSKAIIVDELMMAIKGELPI